MQNNILKSTIKIMGFCILGVLIKVPLLFSGPYLNSAHGDGTNGVHRSDAPIASYTAGHCAHCHEQHASIDGAEPNPAGASASEFCLFSDNFDNARTAGPYIQADNFCFYCHINSGGLQDGGGITNKPYSNTFAGYTTDYVTDILGAFNYSTSYHNLYDIQRFSKDKFDFFKDTSNPCVACHNPHLAKRNKQSPAAPTQTAISRPTDHENLWGDDENEQMNNYTYRAPYNFGSTSVYEPDGSVLHDGSLVPDYNAFCLDCHQYEVPSTKTAGYLTAIDWSSDGDMHGQRARFYGVDGAPPEEYKGKINGPFNVAPQSNYVLSCMDCHEAHGSYFNSGFLIRREINGGQVVHSGGDVRAVLQSSICDKCHSDLHSTGNGCYNCHYHGSTGPGTWNKPCF